MVVEKSQPSPTQIDSGKIVGWVGLGVLFLVIVMGVTNAWVSINPGERGIVVELGKPVAIFDSGFHWKTPFIQDVVLLSIKTVKFEAHASAASKDLQTVAADVAVNYHLDGSKTLDLYSNIGTNSVIESSIVSPAVQESVKAVTAQFSAEDLITKRPLVKQRIDEELGKRLLERGIILETTSITNFDFSDQFNAAIEAKQTAQQNALTAQNVLAQRLFEAQQEVAKAQGEANSTILRAEAQAAATKLNGDADAYAILTKGEALRKNQDVVRLNLIDKWNGQLPRITGNQPFILDSSFTKDISTEG